MLCIIIIHVHILLLGLIATEVVHSICGGQHVFLERYIPSNGSAHLHNLACITSLIFTVYSVHNGRDKALGFTLRVDLWGSWTVIS